MSATRAPQCALAIELLNQVFDLLSEIGGTSVTAIDNARGEALPHIAAWIQHMRHSVEAADQLHRTGYDFCAAPINRLIVEHAAAIAAVGANPELYVDYLRETYRGLDRVKKARATAELPEYVELSQMLGSTEIRELLSNRTRTTHKDRFARLGPMGPRFYVTWLDTTQASHAGHVTGTLFLRQDPHLDVPTMTVNPQYRSGRLDSLLLGLDCMTLALDVFSGILKEDPWRESVVEVNLRKDVLIESESSPHQPRPFLGGGARASSWIGSADCGLPT